MSEGESGLQNHGKVFQQMKVDKFKEMFEIVCDVLHKLEKEENAEDDNKILWMMSRMMKSPVRR